jgi:hypothetical protein
MKQRICNDNKLGILDTERFVALLLREPFDYTEWHREHLFAGMSLDEIIDAADKYCKENTDIQANLLPLHP